MLLEIVVTSRRSRQLIVQPEIPFLKWLRRFLARLGITGLMLVLVPLIISIMWLRYYGMPQQVKDLLLTELARHNIHVSVDRLLLDPTGGLLADRLTLYRKPDRQQILLQIDRARIDFAWLSWWQGKPFLQSASVSNADVSLPFGDKETIDFRQVNAKFNLTSTGLDVVSAEARLLNIQLLLQGRIRFKALPAQGKELTAEEKARRDALWRKIEDYAGEIETERPIKLQGEFDISATEPATSTAQVALFTRFARWRGVQVNELGLTAKLADGVLTLDDLHVRLARGEFSLYGQWHVTETKAQLEFSSNLDFTPLAPAFEPRWRDALYKLNFDSLPQISGRCDLDWTEKFNLSVNLDLDWRNFTYGSTTFEKFSLALAYDGHRLLVPDAQLLTGNGALNLEVYYDGNLPQAKARLTSTIDPTVFTGLFGDGADRFLNSCRLPQKGPILSLTASGTSLKLEDLLIKGSVTLGQFFYKNIEFKEATSNFTVENLKLTLPDLKVKRTEGQATGGIIYDFKNRTAQLVKFVTNLNVIEVAPVLGGKFPQYVNPYQFSAPPTLKVDGLVDLQDTKAKLDTNLTVDIDSSATMKWRLFKVDFVFTKPKGRLKFVDRHLTVSIFQSELFSGGFNGVLEMDISKPKADYNVTFAMTNADFAKLMKIVFNSDGTTGTLNGKTTFSGTLDDLESINGTGEMTITDGYLTSIPFLGGLSSVLNAVIPNFGFAKANRARANFILAKGYIETRDLEIYSSNFTLIGNGRYQFIDDDVDLNIRANVRGIVGLLLFPVSKLFEYHGSGSLKSVKWVPANF
ncbi:MAG: hypothetical protein B9S32_02320 [Verrucomicrobia bacterium Tous-C9LFEB]|nr:MAG: hypothetical protein B9S32_02320 [Verrucomicrobia bacterium Tous-C9LFEB]